MHTIRVWDLPVRLFHWSLVLAVAGAVVSAKVGGNAFVWHERCGYAALALVLFRILWGFAGSRYARFASFIYRPSDIVRYARALFGPRPQRHVGHNPLGGLSVFALLGAVGTQAVLGLMSNDDIANEGPLVKFISKELSDRMTWLHADIGQWLIYVLVGLHVLAVLFYVVHRRQNLVVAMITGDAQVDTAAEPADDGAGRRVLAALLLAGCAGLVWFVATR